MCRKSFLLLYLVACPVVFPAELFKWTDEDGTVHMTDTLSQVPPQYRDQADRKSLPEPDRPVRPELEFSIGSSGAHLKHFTVPYRAFEGTARRIIIPVRFNDSVSANLLLDTGSPGLMISPDLARRLGLLSENEELQLKVKAAGIGGTVPAVLSVVDTVAVGEARSEFLPALIAEIPSNDFEGLVGMDFMANYRITIDTKNSVLAFDEMPPHPDRPGGHDEAWWRANFRNFSRLKQEWADYLDRLESLSLSSSERERHYRLAQNQHDLAEELWRRLERYARDNAVPSNWRR